MYEKEKCAHSWTFLASYFFLFHFLKDKKIYLVWHLKGDVLTFGKSNPLDRKTFFLNLGEECEFSSVSGTLRMLYHDQVYQYVINEHEYFSHVFQGK